MAIIIKCRQCKQRLPNDTDPCPACGAVERLFILDHMQNGRYSKRLRTYLPENIATLEDARAIDTLRVVIKKKKVKRETLPSAATVDDLFPKYLEWYAEHRSPTTVTSLRVIYKAHISRILGNEQVTLIDTDHFDLYQTTRSGEVVPLTKRPVKNRTINKELDHFSGFLKWCRRHKKINIPRVYYEKLSAPRPKPEILSIGEVSKILKAADPFYYALILCLYTLGLRFSEANALTPRHIDLESRTVKVTQKGGEEKVLPVDDLLIKALKALKVTDPDAYYFLNKDTVTPEDPRGRPVMDIRKALDRFCVKAEIDRKVRPHMFRHSWATHMLAGNINLRLIQKYLGHAAVTTTEIYTHVMMDNLRDASGPIIRQLKTAKMRRVNAKT